MIRRWFFAGLMVLVPLTATFFVIEFAVGVLDHSLLLLPAAWRPATLFGTYYDIPGLWGLMLSISVILAVGFLADNIFGARVVRWAESMLARVPLVRSVYTGTKKLADVVLGESGTSFSQVILLEYPRKGLWTIGFITGAPLAEASAKTGQELVTAFVPTTPNPTSGFIILIPRAEVIELDMSIEDAMRMVISLGVVTPEVRTSPRKPTQNSLVPPARQP